MSSMTDGRPADDTNTTNTIRFTDYTGDFETLAEVNVIGPFATAAERDAELARLTTLPGVDGSVTFEASSLDPAGADRHMSAAASAAAVDLDTFLTGSYAS